MNRIVFAGSAFSELRNKLLDSTLEKAAILIASIVKGKTDFRYLIKEIYFPSDEDYLEKTSYSCQVKPEFIAPLAKMAKNEGKSLVFVHTHPNSQGYPEFSNVDDLGEKKLLEFLKRRKIKGPHSALVLTNSGCVARQLGTGIKLEIIGIGENLNEISKSSLKFKISDEFDRQIRAFSLTGQRALEKLNIGIVGLGGTGSIVAQQLAYLGVRKYLIMDPDIVEKTNLNRIVGSNKKDIGRTKVEVASRHIKFIRPESTVVKSTGSVLDLKSALLLTETDFIFCCTDSHGSRAIINQLSYQYYIPAIDIGVSITINGGKVTHITGRTQMLAPGLPCLVCSSLLDSDAVRYDLMSSFQRQKDPYFIGSAVPAPAVISLNSTIVSQAITMFLSYATGLPSEARFQIYDGVAGKIRTVKGNLDPMCIVCSKKGALGRGSEWPLSARPNE